MLAMTFCLKKKMSLQTSSKLSSPFKTLQDKLGYIFGASIESFDYLLPVKSPVSVEPSTSSPKPSTSSSKPSTLMECASNMDTILPTNLDVIKNHMFHYDKTRISKKISVSESNSIIWLVTDNLMAYWKLHTAVELR